MVPQDNSDKTSGWTTMQQGLVRHSVRLIQLRSSDTEKIIRSFARNNTTESNLPVIDQNNPPIINKCIHFVTDKSNPHVADKRNTYVIEAKEIVH